MSSAVLDAAKWFHGQGFTPLPVAFRAKNPLPGDWTNYEVSHADFNRSCNLGVLLGARSKGLTDVDFDWPEAAELGRALMPVTWSYGRLNPGGVGQTQLGHMLYLCDSAESLKLSAPIGLAGGGRRVVIEIRSTGLQSVVPPSQLGDDAVAWIDDAKATDLCVIEPDHLCELVSTVAGAAILARLWPDLVGSRHDLMLSLAGACHHAGWIPEKTTETLLALLSVVQDEEKSDRVKAISTTLAAAASGQPVSGLPVLASHLPGEAIDCLRDWWGLGQSNFSQLTAGGQPISQVARANAPASGPQPLPEMLQPVPPFPMECLPEAFVPYVRDVAERMQCPADFPAVGLMIVTAAVVGGQIAVRPKQRDDWEEIPNLWGAIVGRPGVLKTPALAEPMSFLRELEEGARAVWATEYQKYLAAVQVYEQQLAAVKAVLRKRTNSGDIPTAEEIRQMLPEEPVAPVRKRYIINDSTVEKVGALLAENPNGLLLFRDEVTGFIASMEGERYAGERKFYIECHTGKLASTVDRIGRGTVDIPRLCLSVLGGIQPGPLTRYLRDAMEGGSRDDGLFQRFQLLVWPDTPDSLEFVDRAPDAAAREQVRRTLQRLVDLDPADLGAGTTINGQTVQPFLRLSEAAQPIFNAWWRELHEAIKAMESPAMASHLSKYRGLIPSLALLIHLADGGGSAIGPESLTKAVGWYHYLLGHAHRVYAAVPAEEMAAAALLQDRLHKLPDPFTARMVQRKEWAAMGSAKQVAAAIDVLIDYGWLWAERVETGGRPTVHFWKIKK